MVFKEWSRNLAQIVEIAVWHNYINNYAVTKFSIPGQNKLQQPKEHFHKLSTLHGYSPQNCISCS